MQIPTLDTHRLQLIAPDHSGFDAYQKFYTDAQASEAYGGPITAAQAWTRLQSDLGSWHLSGFGVWMITLRSSGAVVGTCGFWQGHGWPRELTWWLLPEARGQGLAQEASIAVLQHAYDGFGWDAVETYMQDDNMAARKLVERLGGQLLRRMAFPDGQQRDLYHFPRPSPRSTAGKA